LPEVDLDARGNNAPLIAAGGGLLLFISLFLDWFEGVSAWEIFDLTDLVLAVLALIALAIGAMIATGNTANLPATPSAIVTTSGLIAFSMVATYIFEGEEKKFGIFLGLIGAIAMIVGGVQLARGVTGAGAPRRSTATEPPPPPPPANPTV
jgi:hypothetical protein